MTSLMLLASCCEAALQERILKPVKAACQAECLRLHRPCVRDATRMKRKRNKNKGKGKGSGVQPLKRAVRLGDTVYVKFPMSFDVMDLTRHDADYWFLGKVQRRTSLDEYIVRFCADGVASRKRLDPTSYGSRWCFSGSKAWM